TCTNYPEVATAALFTTCVNRTNTTVFRFSLSAFSLPTQRQNPFHHSIWKLIPDPILATRVRMLSTTTSIPAPDELQTSSPTAGVGLANVRLNQSRRRLLDLLNKLFNTGVQADVDIPQIAVIGAQSAGKSSL
ncbi:hypothetical protein AB1N83_014245, partial [Pleurotus pulmonarius]